LTGLTERSLADRCLFLGVYPVRLGTHAVFHNLRAR
jgi:hypothetical protein